MIADDEKDAARRNELLSDMVTHHKDKAPLSLAICRLFLESVFDPEPAGGPLDFDKLDQVIASIPENGRSNAEFFVGWFLKNHGDPARARAYLQRTLESRFTDNWYYYLVKGALARMDPK